MSKVKYQRLGDIVNFKRGYDLPAHQRKQGNYPVVSSSGISGYHSEYKADGEGIVTGRYGTLGEMHYVNGKYWPHNTALYVTDFKGNYPKYVYYLLKCLGNLKTSDKSAVPGVNRNDLHALFVPYIANGQENIAAVLSSIDQKIEINNRINAELEAMAKNLYDYWFVQFDFPDENGKPYKSSGGEMVYSKELKREIPAGWKVKELHQIANITMGQSPEGSSYNEEGKGIVFFQGSTDFGIRFPNIRQYTTEPSRLAKAGDILLSVRAPVGTMNIADIDCCIGRGLAALNSKDGFDAYLFYVMEYFKRLFDRRNSEGTTFGSITKSDLFSLQVAYPNNLVLKAYNDVIAINNKLVLKNQKENQQLAALRDWLLPMLMNGQVQVTDTKNH
ncbi:restriction endonuclease subunit S [Thiolinea disciformis]|uniref:restriction endonuclease subunit S n=1 Tax=Thiolinea disciformis TaxID=125614 RepID=UPI000381B605|nr:restriction endonuclease subunit S [Thiolinea disciformis]